ncbi:MAG TPA: hypothetical protein VM238_02710 [Phycisphaerae bacterium]|nr:hypothetical protein [Phycisphaerae bacterium]
MKTFDDNAGRTWTVAVTINAVKRVKGLLDVDLTDLMDGDPPLLTRLDTDIVLLCDVIFALVKPQADEQGVTDEAFAEALGGDAIIAAHDALLEELADFFRSLRRTDVTKAVEKQIAMVRAAVQAAEARIEAVDVDREIEEAFRSGDLSGNSPGSSEPTPDR